MLAVGAYLPALRMPFVEDDYVIIPTSNVYAHDHWTPLWHDIDFRTRPMQLFMNVAVDRVFGYKPRPYYAANILLHALCVLLIYAAGAWIELGFTAAFWGACFFAVYEGHAEAILWPSGSSELLVFLFWDGNLGVLGSVAARRARHLVSHGAGLFLSRVVFQGIGLRDPRADAPSGLFGCHGG